MIVIASKRFLVSLFLILSITVFFTYVSIDFREPVIDQQNIFFWGIVAILGQSLVGLSLYSSHRKVVSYLKRISEINNLQHPYSQKMIARMGVLGIELEHMLNEQNNTVVLRSNRISALNTLVRMLSVGYSEPIMITDVNGVVLSMSVAFSKKLNKNDSDASLSIKKLSDFREDIPLPEVLSHLEKLKLPWSDPEVKGVISTPVFDKENSLHFCIWEFESEVFNKQFREHQVTNIKKRTRGTVRGMVNIFSRKNKHSK